MGRTGRKTELTKNTLILVVEDLHGLPVKVERPSGTEAIAGSAVNAAVFVTSYFLIQGFHFDAPGAELKACRIDILARTGELNHHPPFFFWRDTGKKDVEGQLEVLDYLADYRLVHQLPRKDQDKTFVDLVRCHHR